MSSQEPSTDEPVQFASLYKILRKNYEVPDYYVNDYGTKAARKAIFEEFKELNKPSVKKAIKNFQGFNNFLRANKICHSVRSSDLDFAYLYRRSDLSAIKDGYQHAFYFMVKSLLGHNGLFDHLYQRTDINSYNTIIQRFHEEITEISSEIRQINDKSSEPSTSSSSSSSSNSSSKNKLTRLDDAKKQLENPIFDQKEYQIVDEMLQKSFGKLQESDIEMFFKENKMAFFTIEEINKEQNLINIKVRTPGNHLRELNLREEDSLYQSFLPLQKGTVSYGHPFHKWIFIEKACAFLNEKHMSKIINLAERFFFKPEDNQEISQLRDKNTIYYPDMYHRWMVNLGWLLSHIKKENKFVVMSNILEEAHLRRSSKSKEVSAFAKEIYVLMKAGFELKKNKSGYITLTPPKLFNKNNCDTNGEPGSGINPASDAVVENLFEQFKDRSDLILSQEPFSLSMKEDGNLKIKIKKKKNKNTNDTLDSSSSSSSSSSDPASILEKSPPSISSSSSSSFSSIRTTVLQKDTPITPNNDDPSVKPAPSATSSTATLSSSSSSSSSPAPAAKPVDAVTASSSTGTTMDSWADKLNQINAGFAAINQTSSSSSSHTATDKAAGSSSPSSNQIDTTQAFNSYEKEQEALTGTNVPSSSATATTTAAATKKSIQSPKKP